MNIRLENEKDYYEVENITREAFRNVYRPGCFEHYILHKLRNIEYTMQKARKLGFNEIVITGSPEYYKKYGFESASKYEIYYDGADKNEELPVFMICVLNKGNNNTPKGIYSDPKCYLNIDEKKLEEFDKNFPFKIKEKRENKANL